MILNAETQGSQRLELTRVIGILGIPLRLWLRRTRKAEQDLGNMILGRYTGGFKISGRRKTSTGRGILKTS